jgi:hypothetical protein
MNNRTALFFIGIYVVGVIVASEEADLTLLSRNGTLSDITGRGRFPSVIPKVWDDAIMPALELPSVEPAYTPQQIKADYYYKIPVRPIYRSYPVYRPDKEPKGYYEGLLQKEPEILWDDKDHRPDLKTEADWLRAGEMVFDSPITIDNGRMNGSGNAENFLRNPAWYIHTGTPVTADGKVPFYSYIIRQKGKIEIGTLSCTMCHTRMMPGGVIVKGAQGNFPFSQAFAEDVRFDSSTDPSMIEAARAGSRLLYRTPWLNPDPLAALDGLASAEFAAVLDLIPPGVLARHRLRPDEPVQIPDLIGVQSQRYLDRTGLQRHHDIVDLMRYAALNQGADFLSSSGGWVPLTEILGGHPLPVDPKDAPPGVIERYSDEQLYALARFVYSLKPPPNPNAFDAKAARGQQVFTDEGCAKCHDPKQGYTNNKLIAAPGFVVPTNHPERVNVMNSRVDTDGKMTLTTRRGTGFYKVPSLLGVWYRGPFEHNGSVATLEDWFDRHRLDAGYVPTGWKGPIGTTTRAVKGHEFGLDLTNEEREALIAFLRTL